MTWTNTSNRPNKNMNTHPNRIAQPYTAIVTDDLPTPPPETLVSSKQATIYVPTPIHPDALAHARAKFGKVLSCEDVEPEMGFGFADRILNRANPLPKYKLDQAHQLSAISVVGVGVDSIDLHACRERGIVTMNCPGANSSAVAELTLSLTLALLRRVPELDRRLRSGEKGLLSIHNMGKSLRGKVVGLVGMGDTARKVAELFHHAFDCSIHVYSPTTSPSRWTTADPAGSIPHIRHADLAAMLPQIDIVSLHCPLTESTRDLISTSELNMMKPDAILVNMSRGAVVDEKALQVALSSQTIWAAASDVFEVEPAQKESMNGLMDLDNFVATPHIGGSTVEAQKEVCILAIDQLARYFDGFQIRNRVC
ncbi:hypothetical protein I317_05483 [Kwoniella heveanensis CBS 569]|nr:hypothetical protein I317_05483 [Kwoniella heveanensis CBS 569]